MKICPSCEARAEDKDLAEGICGCLHCPKCGIIVVFKCGVYEENEDMRIERT